MGALCCAAAWQKKNPTPSTLYCSQLRRSIETRGVRCIVFCTVNAFSFFQNRRKIFHISLRASRITFITGRDIDFTEWFDFFPSDAMVLFRRVGSNYSRQMFY